MDKSSLMNSVFLCLFLFKIVFTTVSRLCVPAGAGTALCRIPAFTRMMEGGGRGGMIVLRFGSVTIRLW